MTDKPTTPSVQPVIAENPYASPTQRDHNHPLQQGGVTAEQAYDLQNKPALTPAATGAASPKS